MEESGKKDEAGDPEQYIRKKRQWNSEWVTLSLDDVRMR